MLSKLKTLAVTVLLLIAFDFANTVALSTFAPKLLVRFFDYGRSVPGKLAQWEAAPAAPGNLYEVAWQPRGLALSKQLFSQETAGQKPTLRVYGMSFVNHIVDAAHSQRSSLVVDKHSGPNAPPNYTYSFFVDDRGNRRAGDIDVLGILSSSVPAMAALSNRTWSFEQPAPFTYPVFYPEGDSDLSRIDPMVRSLADQRGLVTDPHAAAVWEDQMRSVDGFYSAAAFALPWLDASPLMRLARRSLAQSTINHTKKQIVANPEGSPYAYGPVLRRMARKFADVARSDRQVPIVVLVQSRDPNDANLLGILKDTLVANGIPYLATAEIQNPYDPAAFISDGHYTPEVNQAFGSVLLKLIDQRSKP